MRSSSAAAVAGSPSCVCASARSVSRSSPSFCCSSLSRLRSVRLGASDPGYVLPKPASGKRQPMVQVALERYQRDQQRRQGGAGEQAAPVEP